MEEGEEQNIHLPHNWISAVVSEEEEEVWSPLNSSSMPPAEPLSPAGTCAAAD